MANVSKLEMTDISQLIGENYSQLTKSEKQIAKFVIDNRDEAAFLSAGEIALRLELSEATLVRFARTMGFNSYPALRTLLQENFRLRVNRSTSLHSRLDELRESGGVFERLVASEINTLAEALHTVDYDTLDSAMELIRTRARVFVFGEGKAVSLVDQLEISLTRSGRHVIPIKNSGLEMLGSLLLIKNEDLLIAFGFSTLTPNLLMSLEQAKMSHTPVIFITDTLGPQVKNQVTVVISARLGLVSTYQSLTVPMTIINVLLLLISQFDGEQIKQNIDQLEKNRKRYMEILHNLS